MTDKAKQIQLAKYRLKQADDSINEFNPSNLTVFRSLYPEGRNFVLSPNVRTPYRVKADYELIEIKEDTVKNMIESVEEVIKFIYQKCK